MIAKYKQIAQEQCSKLVNQAALIVNISQPNEGWIKTVRSALAMSGAALSKRLGGHRSTASYLERSELDGSISLKKMQQTAEAMNCRFVYAIVPTGGAEDSIESIIERRAKAIARVTVEETSVHMMLEAQQLSKAVREKEVERLKKQLINDMPRNFWVD